MLSQNQSCIFINVLLSIYDSQKGTPPPGFEPGTNRLTVDGSTAELQRNDGSEPTASLGGVPPMVT